MNGLKVYFEDNTNFTIDNTEKIFEISVYRELFGSNSITAQKIYDITPASLLLKDIIENNFEGKHITRVEWYVEGILLAVYEGNIQMTHNILYNGKIEERISFLLLPSI